MKKIPALLTLVSLLCAMGSGLNAGECQQKPYEENWTSLRKHSTPEWLYDMKFGIYFHWGPQTIQTANPDKELSTLEAIEMWTGENFDAKSWVDLIEAAGAQFGGPVAWHCSGMVNWDSDITEWDAVNHGPKVDIFGGLAKELRARDMKVVSSYHTSANADYIWGRKSKSDPTIIDPTQDNSHLAGGNQGRIGDDVLDAWYDRITEAIDKYEPDLVWLDVGFGGTVMTDLRGHSDKGRLLPGETNELRTVRENYQQQLISHYYNKGIEWGKAVEIIYKSYDVPPGIGMRDIEDGNLVGLQYDPWMADINMARHFKWPSPWFYNPENLMKNANTLVDMLADMTSKNGRMLLNVPPMPDGTFSEDTVKQLHAMGDWLKINGEAIYGTIPWVWFGEGPTEVTNPGHHGQGKAEGTLIPNYTAEDIRFTQNGKTLYAICLDWPGEEIAIRTLGSAGKLYPGDIKRLTLLGAKEQVEWQHNPDALVVKFPKKKPCDFAYVIKIERI